MDYKRNLCVTEDGEWDVFIAYYGDKTNGTELQAMALYNAINGRLLSNGHSLKVYQHTCTNPGGPFGDTPDEVMRSRMFILLVDKNIPTDKWGCLVKRNSEKSMKRLYEELKAFRESHSFREYFAEPVCSVIVCDDMPFTDAESLFSIFGGRPTLRWKDLINENFLPILKQISYFLIRDDHIPSEGKDDLPIANNAISVTASRGEITIGKGAQKRLMRLSGGRRGPYERIQGIKELNQGREDNHFINFLPPINTPFIPDAEVFADCERILCSLENAEQLSQEESVFLQFIQDIRDGRKESRQVARICEISPMNTYGRFEVRFQPIEYLWIMRMTMLDTPFDDGNEITTLRKKYANPVEESETFCVADRLACHSGCGVFIITSDGYLVYQNRFDVQNNRVSFFPGKLSYTVSGSYLFNGGSVFDFMNEKIDRELGLINRELYLWELGYEYDYLHYQFSFFAFCEETLEEFVNSTNPSSAQAKSYSFFNLRDCMSIVKALRPDSWESSAWAMLTNALMSHVFKRLLKQKCEINFDIDSFKHFFRL